ncbi:zinc finger MYM-type 1-like, partial [Paramuricea clavata]
KKKEARLQNEKRGERTFDQLNWGKAVPSSKPMSASSSLATNPITKEDNLPIEPSNSRSDNKVDSGENNAFEINVNEATSEEAITVAGSSCDDYSNCKVTESTICLALTSTDVLMHDKTSEESSTDEYPESSADNGESVNVTSTESTEVGEVFLPVRGTLVKMGPQLPPRILPKDSKSRSFPMSIFSKVMPSGETVARDWLVWSETTQNLFCFCCCLFARKSASATQSEFSHPQLGCNDNWRKLYEKTQSHEKSFSHVSNYMKWRDLVLSLEMCKGVDSLQQHKLVKEKERWCEIVKSLLQVTLHLAERNLPFRGSLELIANHDSTIQNHLDTVRKHQQQGEPEVAPEIKSFFRNVQRLYNLFSGSPARWKILKETAGVSLHGLSDTRWSARIDAVHALVKNHIKLLEVLSQIQTDLDLTDLGYSDAEILLVWMKSFEYILMATFWFKVLQCIDDVNKVLQYADISIADGVKHLSSLQNDVQNLRDSWESVLEEAKLVSSSLGQRTTLKEKRSRTMTAEESFKINIYYKALDSLLVQLSERYKVIDTVARRFDVIVNPPTDPNTEVIQEQAQCLAYSYPNDIVKDDLEEELRHFVKFFQLLGTSTKRNRALSILNHIYDKKLECLYPQICICLRIFLSIPVSVASGERSFSKLALIKNRLRSTMSQERLSSLMLLSIEHKFARTLDYEDLISTFAREKARKNRFNCFLENMSKVEHN